MHIEASGPAAPLRLGFTGLDASKESEAADHNLRGSAQLLSHRCRKRA